jgi:hypothetical protein
LPAISFKNSSYGHALGSFIGYEINPKSTKMAECQLSLPLKNSLANTTLPTL